MMYCKEPLRD